MVTVALLPLMPFTQVLISVKVASFRVLVLVQVITESPAVTVSVLPLSAVALPVQARVAL